MYDYENQPTEPFRVTPGFIAFLGLLFLPIVLALAIYLGAWAVSSEVYAAEAAAADQPVASQPANGFNTVPAHQVAGWKRALVSACPLH
jgi:hypothetical protein